MSRSLFGTDGIRGVANQELTPELAFNLGQATARHLLATQSRPTVVLGRDTRLSGSMLEAALSAGFASLGVDVISLGIVPTPTVSFVARLGPFALGGIISASHNPAPDNGIKFVGHDGKKLLDSVEEAIESNVKKPIAERPTGGHVGSIALAPEWVEGYLKYLEGIVPEGLAGMTVAVDAAHGAAFVLGPEILRHLGADVILTGTEPDGLNINAFGGATKPDTICRLTVEAQADIGVAFDGDADRAIFSDEKGQLINGDRTIGIWAAYHHELQELNPPTVVGTIMTNGGFEHYLKGLGIDLVRTAVGDKYVAEQLTALNAQVGGEQSGHIIFPDRGATGDGLITMLELLRVVRRSGRPASEWVSAYTPWPQLLTNYTVSAPKAWQASPEVNQAVQQAEEMVAGRGRVNVRASGTQPILRVMVEADSYELRDRAAQLIEDPLVETLGGTIYSKVDLTHALGD